MLQGGSELDTAQCPVNQWIVSGEPVMSENDPTVGVQRGNIECHWGDIARGKSDREVGCFGDYSGGCTVEQTENDQRYRVA